MATAARNTNGNSTTRKSASRKPASGRTASSQSKTRRSSNGQYKSDSSIPAWTATIASIVGVGVAVGAGLYATRRQWLPQAERWGDQISSRFRNDGSDEDFYGDSLADRDDDGRDWEDDKISRGAYPDRDLYPGAQAVS